MRISAIIPVRDGERYLAEAIDSIFGQTRAVDEVIVVDDGSSDASAEIAESYGDPVVCLRRDAGGVGAAVGAGVESASGELLSFLDADDLWSPDKLELQSEALEREPDVDMVFGRATQFISPDLGPKQRSELRAPIASARAKLKGTMLIRRAAIERVGPFATSQLWVADFVDWYARAQEAGLREAMIEDVVLHRRLHETNLGRTRPEARVEYAQVLAAARRRRSGPPG